MLKKAVEKALNAQMNAEFSAAHLYLSMAAFFATKNLGGFAHWMREQAKEETLHAIKFFDFILERGGKVSLSALPAPAAAFGVDRHEIIEAEHGMAAEEVRWLHLLIRSHIGNQYTYINQNRQVELAAKRSYRQWECLDETAAIRAMALLLSNQSSDLAPRL